MFRDLSEVKIIFAFLVFATDVIMVYTNKLTGGEYVGTLGILVPSVFAVIYLDKRNKRRYDSE